mmetsp:Transcript_14447/g.34831  ORF Transcript_14447/g.34831 Transcript_14447/m.34831 type:complete len:223 (-) Transcript_14447:1092-1760(-)
MLLGSKHQRVIIDANPGTTFAAKATTIVINSEYSSPILPSLVRPVEEIMGSEPGRVQILEPRGIQTRGGVLRPRHVPREHPEGGSHPLPGRRTRRRRRTAHGSLDEQAPVRIPSPPRGGDAGRLSRFPRGRESERAVRLPQLSPRASPAASHPAQIPHLGMDTRPVGGDRLSRIGRAPPRDEAGDRHDQRQGTVQQQPRRVRHDGVLVLREGRAAAAETEGR